MYSISQWLRTRGGLKFKVQGLMPNKLVARHLSLVTCSSSLVARHSPQPRGKSTQNTPTSKGFWDKIAHFCRF